MNSRPVPKSMTMPTLFPANPLWGDQKTIHYNEIKTFTVNYRTEKAALAPYLPEGIIVPENPLMMVTYSMCRGIREMAGTGYNMVSVTVGARYEGKQDKYDGNLCLVIWEDKFPPVLQGREHLGFPKLVAEIDDAWMGEDRWGWRVSENGTCFLEGELYDLVKLSEEECRAVNAASVSDFSSGDLNMTYKVIPGANYDEEPITAHMVGVVERSNVKEAWSCKGSLQWCPVTPQSCYLCYGIIESLSRLPVVKYEPCMITRRSHVIEMGNSRRLI